MTFNTYFYCGLKYDRRVGDIFPHSASLCSSVSAVCVFEEIVKPRDEDDHSNWIIQCL